MIQPIIAVEIPLSSAPPRGSGQIMSTQGAPSSMVISLCVQILVRLVTSRFMFP